MQRESRARNSQNFIHKFVNHPVAYSLLSTLLLSLPWFGLSGVWSFVGFVPLLMLHKRLKEEQRKGFLWWVTLTLMMWHGMCCYWVSFATAFAVPSIMLTSWSMLFPSWLLFHFVDKLGKKALSYTLLVSGWIVCEWWYSAGDISFPWLQLGSAFFNEPSWVQWYSLSGSYGGTLWVMVVNLLIFEAVSNRATNNRKNWHWAAFCILIPVVCSLAMYYSYDEPQERVDVAVIQPNVDAYEKFSDHTPMELTTSILELAAEASPSTRLFVAPETAITSYLNERKIGSNQEISRIQEFLRSKFPEAGFVIGFSSYDERTQFNSAVLIDTASVTIYHKGKLVLGVEVVPEWIKGIAEAIDMGGYVGSLGKSEERSVVELGGVNVGAAICYESIYGEYFSEWSFNGADLLCVITNDGWWGDTEGYHQHFAFSRLRAVESRRSIVRSANTGISGIINSRGDVLDELGWDERGIIESSVSVGGEMTAYSRWGDIVLRVAFLAFGLSLLYSVSDYYKAKSRL